MAAGQQSGNKLIKTLEKKMDKATREYRKTELAKVATEYSEYKTRIKIIKPNGETKWLDIENDEFLAIQKILLGESVVYSSTEPKK